MEKGKERKKGRKTGIKGEISKKKDMRIQGKRRKKKFFFGKEVW